MTKDTMVGLNVHDVARMIRRDFDRRAREQGLTRARWQVLWHLARHEGVHQAALAEILDVAPISLTRQLERLEQEGLVERRGDPAPASALSHRSGHAGVGAATPTGGADPRAGLRRADQRANRYVQRGAGGDARQPL